MKPSIISLSKAIAEDCLSDFIDQAERDGVGEVTAKDFSIALAALITAPPPADRTSRSRARAGSRGTQTR